MREEVSRGENFSVICGNDDYFPRISPPLYPRKSARFLGQCMLPHFIYDMNYIIIYSQSINVSNPHPAGLASLYRDKGVFLLAEIHYKKLSLLRNPYLLSLYHIPPSLSSTVLSPPPPSA
jgi:hypothetical protein